ncbi:class I SAM-dependent methyltransferase [Ruegeria sp. EL01]|jgi:ubiquinone/menaquinone biosynthesis C-methylase UbiE|uniref:class I SAM-dependent methyltransferase n=1 Tax=Ruegeria sp. EL01 TaxID=2107578 RepID=UPI000EA832B8|nr:class I SAM-dependent methyltransferase [Ruegeria sp. EL01]
MDSTSFWDNAAPKYAKSPISDMAGYEQTLDRIRDLLKPHHRVLELGCGTGSTALELAGGVHSYLGTDLSKQMIEIANEKYGGTGPHQLRFAVAGAGDLPVGLFDVVLALNVLHLLPNLEAVLEEVFAALPSGGLFVAKTTLLAESPWYVRWLIPFLRAIGKAPYVRFLAEKELEGMFRNAGFLPAEALTQDGMAPRFFSVVTKP